MSRLPFELLLALRYLRPKRTFVSVITLISILGVMLGVAVLIIVISVMSGFDHDLREKVFGFNAHIKVVPRGDTMRDYALVASQIATNRLVKGVAPFVLSQVLVETQPVSGQKSVFVPVVRGVDPEAEATVSSLPKEIIGGKFDVSNRGLVIGSVFATNMGLWVGDRVTVYSWKDLRRMKDSYEQKREQAVVRVPDDYTVRGVFDAGHYEFNSGFIITSLEDAQTLCDLDESDTVHGLMVALYDPLQPQTAAREIQHQVGPEYEVTTWMEDSPLMMAVLVENNLVLYILFFIVIVAAFGITCTLITFIVMKTREIGLMKALGATNRQVMWVFLGQSLIVSVLGVLAGVGMGLAAIAYRNEFLNVMRQWTGFELFPASIYGFNRLPALVVPGDVLIICGGSLLICLAAAAFPARSASKLNPVEALRHE